MKHILLNTFLFLIFASSGYAQKNLDFERWDINNLGVDEALNWTNVCDASKYGAPLVMIKEVDDPANGLASVKLITKYWKGGKDYQLDTLVGALIQEKQINTKPQSFSFSYKSNPKKGDEVLIGVQLSADVEGKKVIVGEGYFSTNQKQKKWLKKEVDINYFTNHQPTILTIIAISSACAASFKGNFGSMKTGSTLSVDDIRIHNHKNLPNLTLLNTVK